MRLFQFESRRFLQAAAAIGVANAAFWVIGHWLNLERATFNLDLVLALVVMAALPRLGLVLLVLAWLCDWVVAQSLIFHFPDPWEFVRSTRFVTTINVSSYFTAALMLTLLPFASCLAVLLWRIRLGRQHWPYLALIAVGLAGADVLNGSSAMSGRDVRVVSTNIAGSPTVSITSQMLTDSTANPLTPVPERLTVTGVARVKQWSESHVTRSVILVVVESMGRHRSSQVRDWLSARLANSDVQARYEIQALDVPFNGATTSAELRELCALSGAYHHLNADIGRDCLPSTLVAQGWRTEGIHGFSSAMFARDTWWTQIGLQQRRFAETLREQGLPSCGGAFRGICDEKSVQLAFREATSPRSFVYLLTLNTHLPLASVNLSDSELQICYVGRLDDEVCQMVAQIGRVLYTVGKEAAAAASAPLILVVGDHAPPFVRSASREQFDQKFVPAYILRPLD